MNNTKNVPKQGNADISDIALLYNELCRFSFMRELL
jgi:hypothetical protein